MPEEHKNDPVVRAAARVIVAGGIAVGLLVVVVGWSVVGKFISYRMEMRECDVARQRSIDVAECKHCQQVRYDIDNEYEACVSRVRRNF